MGRQNNLSLQNNSWKESDRSYGIEVARIAGLPNELIKVANKTLESFEKKIQNK